MFADHGCRSMKFFNYFVKGVLGYPTGAPRCDVKKPGHGHQVREAPFRKVDRVYGYCPNSFDARGVQVGQQGRSGCHGFKGNARGVQGDQGGRQGIPGGEKRC